jgi:cytochrome oxidase Cu insertion factor (SCO1/SenC/PrrC family)
LVLAIIIMGVGFGLKVFNKKTAEAQFGTTSSVLKSYSTGTPDIGGEYSLINQDREAVSNNTYLGRYTLIVFGYTFCPDVCPNTLATFSSALDLLGEDAEKLNLIFITVDPARDTPENLKSYLIHFHKNFDGLTGSIAQIEHVKKIFRIYAVKSQQDEPDVKQYLMDHSAVSYLLGPDGKYVTFFRYGAEAEVISTKLNFFL